MNTNDSQPAEARQPRPVYYEPDHEGDTLDTITGVLALRGYRLTSDESWLASFGTHAMVTVEGNGSLTLHDGDTGTHLPPVEEFPDAETYARAIAAWLDGDEKWSPSEIAETARTWPARRSEVAYRARNMRRLVDELERNANHQTPARFRSGSPARLAERTAKALAEECAQLLRELTEPVSPETVESARVELAGREALAALAQAARGGVR